MPEPSPEQANLYRLIDGIFAARREDAPIFECDRCGYRARQSRRPSQCEGCGTLTGTFTEHE